MSYYADSLVGATYTSYLLSRVYGTITPPASVFDQFAPETVQLSMALAETYSPTQQGVTVNTGTGANVVVTDFFVFCSQTCRQNGTQTVTATQTIYANNFSVATKNVTWTCTGATAQ
ncbi:MAG: hypothetical protein ABSH56_33225 [Bryobacteraceae bacterium]|jgi:hypothetical protein